MEFVKAVKLEHLCEKGIFEARNLSASSLFASETRKTCELHTIILLILFLM